MPIATFAFHSSSSWQRLGVSASAQFEIFVVIFGSTCENKTDLDEKRMSLFVPNKNFLTTWLNFTKTLYFGSNNLSQIDVKRKGKLEILWS